MAIFKVMRVASLFAATAFGSGAVAQEFQQDWEGFYGGVHLDGAVYGVTTTDHNSSNAITALPQNSLLVATGGVTGGYNYVLENNLLISAELDYTAEMRIDDFFSTNAAETAGVQFDLAVTGITALRGRAGFIQNNALGYVVMGVAQAATDMETYSVNTGSGNISCDTSNCAKSTEDMLGIVIGAGVEWAFRENWIGRVEIQHYAFENVLAPVYDPDDVLLCGDRDLCTIGYTPKVTDIRMGISYMF